MSDITTVLRIEALKDMETVFASLKAHGPVSFAYPEKFPGLLMAILHPIPPATSPSLTRTQFRDALRSAFAAAPSPIRRESSETVLRRALVKVARGRSLTGAETAALDRAETE